MLAIQQHSVLDALGDHLAVVWGAAVAFGVVVLLTPAVGGMARLLGVVDPAGGRRINKTSVPRLGGLAMFLGVIVPSVAFLPLSGAMKGIVLDAAVDVLARMAGTSVAAVYLLGDDQKLTLSAVRASGWRPPQLLGLFNERVMRAEVDGHECALAALNSDGITVGALLLERTE